MALPGSCARVSSVNGDQPQMELQRPFSFQRFRMERRASRLLKSGEASIGCLSDNAPIRRSRSPSLACSVYQVEIEDTSPWPVSRAEPQKETVRSHQDDCPKGTFIESGNA